MEQTLQPDEQMWIDIGKLIREQIPDKHGNTCPVDLVSGSYEFRDLSDKGVGHVFEGKVIYDKTFGHVAYGCGGPCCDNNPYLTNNPLGIPFQGVSDNGVMSSSNCGGNPFQVDVDFYGGWNTANQGIATVDYYGKHTGVAAGSTTSNTLGKIDQVYGRYSCTLQSRNPSGGDNVASATLSQHTSGTVSSDDAAISNYKAAEGTTGLGAIIGTGALKGCFLANEMVGAITPSTYTGMLTLHRSIQNDAEYTNSTNTGGVTNVDDTSQPPYRDDDPQSGGSAGKIYDVDAPGPDNLPIDGNTYRYRGNFYACAASPDGTRISPYYNYYVRVSCKNTASGYQFVNDVTGDNQVAAGTTLTSWNLK